MLFQYYYDGKVDPRVVSWLRIKYIYKNSFYSGILYFIIVLFILYTMIKQLYVYINNKYKDYNNKRKNIIKKY